MSRLRTGRRKYYDLFSHCYDAFVKLHARRDPDDTRRFLVEAVLLRSRVARRILDVCTGTGSVLIAFAERYPDAVLVGCDFSHGMLRKAKEKGEPTHAVFVEGDAAELPFLDASFDVVLCSHALYELKSKARQRALGEMRRVMDGDGLLLLMEHEVPSRPFLRLLFYMRLFAMSSTDAREFVQGGLKRLETMFARVNVIRSPSEKSRLTICQK